MARGGSRAGRVPGGEAGRDVIDSELTVIAAPDHAVPWEFSAGPQTSASRVSRSGASGIRKTATGHRVHNVREQQPPPKPKIY